MLNENRAVRKDKGELYREAEQNQRYTTNAPEPKDETDLDDHRAADYAASCENRLNNANTFGTKPGVVKNIKEVAGGM